MNLLPKDHSKNGLGANLSPKNRSSNGLTSEKLKVRNAKKQMLHLHHQDHQAVHTNPCYPSKTMTQMKPCPK